MKAKKKINCDNCGKEIIGESIPITDYNSKDYNKNVQVYHCKECYDEYMFVHCNNSECMHHKGTFCMAAQFNCEDRILIKKINNGNK
jgi:hypothetical protein